MNAPNEKKIVMRLNDKSGSGDLVVEKVDAGGFNLWIQMDGGLDGKLFWEPSGHAKTLTQAMEWIADLIKINCENDFYTHIGEE